MGRFISIGHTEHLALPIMWAPRVTEPRFVKVAVPAPVLTAPMPEPTITAPQQVITPPTPTVDDLTAPTPPVDTMTVSMYTPVPEPTTPASVDAQPVPRTPLSQNLLSIRKRLNLTPEEFSRPIIEYGEGLINRLETGFSRPSTEISNLICETWGICGAYLYSGTGPMFEKDDTDNPEKYTILLRRLVKTYLSVATFDKRSIQYWKGSLVDDLARLIDVKKLDGQNMSRIVRLLFDYLDVDQFAEILERMGR